MQSALKTMLLAAAAGFCVSATAVPSQAQGTRFAYPQAYSIYQAPDGSYDSLADLSRDVWGVPCGITCTQRAQARWAHYYGYRHPYGPSSNRSSQGAMPL